MFAISKVFVCAGALVLVSKELSASDIDDSLDALLYSQTVASHKVPDAVEYEAWNDANKTALKVTGALFFDDPVISAPVTTPDTFTLLELTQELLQGWAPAVLNQQVIANLTSQLESNGAALELLQRNTLQEGKSIRFMLGSVSAESTLTMVVISFAVKEPVPGNVLEQRFNAEQIVGNLAVDCYKALIDADDYCFSRARIIALLGERREKQIIALT